MINIESFYNGSIFPNLTVKQIVEGGHLGGSELKDDDITSINFRKLLEICDLDYLKKYVTETTLGENWKSKPFAFQEIANEICRRIFGDIQAGLYKGKRDSQNCDSLVTNPNYPWVIDVKTSTDYAVDLNKMYAYLDRAINNGTLPKNAQALYVVGRTIQDGFIQQLSGQGFLGKVKAVTIQSLIKLLEMRHICETETIFTKVLIQLQKNSSFILDETIDFAYLFLPDNSSTVQEEQGDLDEFDKTTTTSESTPSEKAPRSKAINHLDEWKKLVESHLNIPLIKDMRGKYKNSDKNIFLNFLGSKDHSSSKANRKEHYWFGVNQDQIDYLNKSAKSFIFFGCGSPDQGFLIPINDFLQIYNNINWKSTNEDSTTKHKHIVIYRSNDNPVDFVIEQSNGPLNVNKYRITNHQTTTYSIPKTPL